MISRGWTPMNTDRTGGLLSQTSVSVDLLSLAQRQFATICPLFHPLWTICPFHVVVWLSHLPFLQ